MVHKSNFMDYRGRFLFNGDLCRTTNTPHCVRSCGISARIVVGHNFARDASLELVQETQGQF